MRLPRDVSGDDLARHLARLGYQTTRQSGSHLRLTTDRNGQHHITIPRHAALRIGTLAAVLTELESHHRLDREALLDLLFR
ncbi:MAG: type II toxin-antitoxin system HicA family toxin [Acidobacteriota bacterium]|nr:type II toxin-antitoxin system HicA family toxin [Acidobacteriota bacterium]